MNGELTQSLVGEHPALEEIAEIDDEERECSIKVT